MPILNAVKIHGNGARAALNPGETLLALSPASVGYGVTRGPRGAELKADRRHDQVRSSSEHVGTAVERAEGSTRPRRPLVRILLAPLALVGAGPMLDPQDFPESLLGGRTCQGASGSTAREVQHVVRKSRQSYLVITDQRVVLLDEADPGNAMPVLWEAPRSVVVSAGHRPRMFARARFVLHFGDGSWIVLSAWSPNIGSWHPKRIVKALA